MSSTRALRQRPSWVNRLYAILAAAVIVAVPVRATAQSTEPPDESMLVGPVAFVPVLELRSLGYDSNVFNEDVNPRGDVSGSFVPSADYHLRMGRARLVGRTTVAFVYFQQFSGQRSIDVAQDVKFAVPMNRLTPYISGTFLNTKQRPGLDIDLRARRIVIDLLAGLDLRLGGKTTLGGSVSAAKESFAEQTIVEGVSLREQLTRRTETGVVQLTHALTPLTTISVAVEAERQTFSYDPSRDSTSFRIAPRVEFKPSALIHGSATVGYRSVMPSTPIVEPFSGLVAGVDLAYIFRGTTRIAVSGERDLVYSYRPAYPVLRADRRDAVAPAAVVRRVGDAGDRRTAVPRLPPASRIPAARGDCRRQRCLYGLRLWRGPWVSTWSNDTNWRRLQLVAPRCRHRRTGFRRMAFGAVDALWLLNADPIDARDGARARWRS